jgi:hypothetical protein
MRCGLIAAGATLAAVLSLPLPVAAAPSVGQRVSVSGCAFAGVTASCLMIKGADGTVYNITGVSPRPRMLDRMIRVRGTVSDKMSICNQGIVLDRIRWSRTRQQCRN